MVDIGVKTYNYILTIKNNAFGVHIFKTHIILLLYYDSNTIL